MASFSGSAVSAIPLAIDPATAALTNCVVAGWGYTSIDSEETTDDLRYLDLGVLSDDYCMSSYQDTYNVDKMLCAGYKEGNLTPVHIIHLQSGNPSKFIK